MPLKLMYITNKPEIARIAEESGVDIIFVDMEFIGKYKRQGGMNTVQNHHTVDDVAIIKKALKRAKLLVRVNPIHDSLDNYFSSEEEINGSIENGADIIMLPYFKNVFEVKRFVRAVNGRAKTMLLLETPEAVKEIDKILLIEGIDYIHIGLNDLSLGLGKKFMFELLSEGIVEELCIKIRNKGIPYGFGGIASLGKGLVPSEKIIIEHYRLESSFAILSRSFCNTDVILDPKIVNRIFKKGIFKIRKFEKKCEHKYVFFRENKQSIIDIIKQIKKG